MIGLDVSDRSIKVVEIDDQQPPRLRTVCWSPLTPNLIRRGIIRDVSAVAEAIAQAMTKCTPVPIEGKKITVSIPERQSFVRVLDLPIMPVGEMDEAILWAIRQHIPFDLERVHVDWQPLAGIPSKADRQFVLVGVAQREVIDPLLEVTDLLELRVVALELEAQAITRSLLPTDPNDLLGILMIDLGAMSTNIIYFDQGAIRFTTSIQRGGDYLTETLASELHLTPSIAAEKKALVGVKGSGSDEVIAETLQRATIDLVKQIRSVLSGVVGASRDYQELRTILIAGGAANLPGIIDVFTRVFPGVPVQIGNPLINVVSESDDQISSLTLTDATHFTTAFGLALRPEDTILAQKG